MLLCIWKTSMYTTVGHFFFYFVVKSFGLKSKRMFPISSNIITNTISVSVMWINAIFVVITMRCSSVPGIDLNHWIKWFALQPIFYFWQTVRILSIDCGWHQIGSICAVHSLVMVCRWTCTYMPCLNETHRELEQTLLGKMSNEPDQDKRVSHLLPKYQLPNWFIYSQTIFIHPAHTPKVIYRQLIVVVCCVVFWSGTM